MKLRKDIRGAAGAKTMVALIAVLAVVLLLVSGILSISIPTTKVTDKYSETVKRGVLDVGMKVPIDLKLTFVQDAKSGTSRAEIDATIQHKHDSADSITGDVVPDAEVITNLNYGTKVGTTVDTTTIFAVNGNSFQATNLSNQSTMQSLAAVQYGRADTNYKVWTTSTVHVPPTTPGSTSDDNSALIVQTMWKHYRKATNQLLSSDTVTFVVYYKLPAYNVNHDYTQSFQFFVYVPFDDYAVVEDIRAEIRAYTSRAVIKWTTVETVTHTFWDFPVVNGLFGGFLDYAGVGRLKLVMSKDSALATAINYDWKPLRSVFLNNGDLYGSHSYTYKIR